MQPVSDDKLRFVDALRGFAILGVLVIHCGQIGSNEFSTRLQIIIVNGALGVQLFFVASAFTIFLTYSNRYDRETNPTTNFFIRRFFRIAPMYYLGIIYFLYQDGFGARYWLGDASYVSTWNVLSNLLFVHSINPYWITSVVPGGWSIAVEVCFYCLVPFLFLRIRDLNKAIVMFMFTIFLRMALQSLLQRFPVVPSEHLWREYLFFYPPDQFPVFACGIILYFLIKTPPADWRVEPLVLLTFSLLILAQLLTQTTFIFPVHIQFAMAFVVLGYALSRIELFILVNTVTIYIGKISYSMYLVHFAVLHWLVKFNIVDFVPASTPYYPIVNYVLRFCTLTVLTVLLSSCTYYLIEVSFQSIGKSIVKRREHVSKSLAPPHALYQ
jgi:peptidoglycan/LPS O-acetylase OafA/YrhL